MSKSPALRRIQADVRELTIDPSDRYHAHPLENDMFEWYVWKCAYQLLNVFFEDYSNESALLIPQGIISENANGEQYIYVIKDKTGNDKATAEKRIIETGLTQGDYIEVIKGLDPGIEIIQEGARSVNDGQEVKIINQDS